MLGDPELDSLIEQALDSNLDRQTAASRVRESRQGAAAERASLFPTLDGNSQASHTRISNNSGLSSLSSLIGGGGAGGSGSSTGSGGAGAASAGFPGIEFDTYQLGLNADFDLDLFGGRRRAVSASRRRLEAQVWSARDTDVALTAEVATAYLQLRAAQARLAVVQANARSQSQLLALIASRARGGLVNDIDTVQQRRTLATTQAQVAPLQASIAVGEHQLALLLGKAPADLSAELVALKDPVAALRSPPASLPVGLPSDLLRRRPDVRQAERELAASVEDVGQATAALYPDVKLTGSFSFVSSELKSLLDADSRNYNYATALTAPLFDAGRLRARKHQTEERAVQASIAYRRAVLAGLRQVEDALVRYAADQRQLIALRAGYADARRAAVLDRAQYLGGLSDLQATFRAEAIALQTQDQLVQTQGQLAADLVAIYRALGGGWETNPAAPTPSSPAG